MKKLIVPTFLLLASSVVFAGSATPTRRYLIEERNVRAAMRLPVDIDGARAEALPHLNVIVADLTDAEVAALRKSPGQRIIEADREVHAFEVGTPTQKISSEASTRAQSVPYGITMVNGPQMWSMARGAGIKVGVIDSGIDTSHPDLKAHIAGGYDFVNNDEDPMDDNGHGTHVAGTIGALDNGIGVVGVAPDVQLYALKVLNAKGSGSLSNIIKAIDWAIDKKLNIISLSLGSADSSDIEERAFQRAADAGVLAIAASGNDYENLNADGLSYPAGYSTVVSVGAINKLSAIASFSQRGTGLSVVAPGVGVLSTYPVGKAESAFIDVDNRSFSAIPVTGTPHGSFTTKVVYSGFGGLEEFPSDVRDNVALIQRGKFKFWEMVANAKAKGAVGVVIMNKEPGNFGATVVIAPTDPSYQPTRSGDPKYPSAADYVWLPAITVSQEDGTQLKSVSNIVRMAFEFDDYEELQGTSMATPHVSGVAALIWSLAPNAKASEIRQALVDGAHDLGDAGYDKVFGNGVVDALASARKVSPQSFPSGPRRRSVRP